MYQIFLVYIESSRIQFESFDIAQHGERDDVSRSKVIRGHKRLSILIQIQTIYINLSITIEYTIADHNNGSHGVTIIIQFEFVDISLFILFEYVDNFK